MRDHVALLAEYNSWANAKVFEAAARLSDDDLHRDVGIYSSSVIGLLNHVLLVDRLWIRQLSGDGEAPDSEDDVLFEDLAELREAREIEDARIVAFTERLVDDDFQTQVRYHTVRQPLVEQQPLASVLAHMFHHQAHHRGELIVGFATLGATVEPFDLLRFHQERGINQLASVA